MRRLYRSLAGCLVCVLCTSCHVVYDHFNQPSYHDISQQPRMCHLVGHTLQLKQDVFLYQYSDTREYALDLPGKMTDLPSSIAEYQLDPTGWPYTDSNALQGKGKKEGYFKHQVIAVIPKGTKLYVSSILEKQTGFESFLSILAYIDDPAYAELHTDLYFLLNKETEDICEFENGGSYLTGRKIPYLNPDILIYSETNLS